MTLDPFHFEDRDWIGLDRSATAARIHDLLVRGHRHVHVQAPPGFGKLETANALAQMLGQRAVLVRLSVAGMGRDPLATLYAGFRADPRLSLLPNSQDDLSPDRLDEILASAVDCGTSESPVLIILDADNLLDDADHSCAWLDLRAAIVTFALSPRHVLSPRASREALPESEIRLRPFPPPSDGYDDVDDERSEQEIEAYRQEGQAWLRRFVDAYPIEDERRSRLEKVFRRKYEDRADLIWSGHPFINMLLLEDMLLRARTTSAVTSAVNEALVAWREGFAARPTLPLRNRLVPFERGPTGGIPPRVADEIAAAVEGLASGKALDPAQISWLEAAGLVVTTGTEIAWSRVAMLAVREYDTPPDLLNKAMLDWAHGLRIAARQSRRALEERSKGESESFRVARAEVVRMFCDNGPDRGSRIEPDESRILLPDLAYAFRISMDAKPTAHYGAEVRPRERVRPSFDVLVFEAEREHMPLWRHHIRVMSMLGRLKHPALGAFMRGGEINPGEGESSSGRRVYLKIDRLLERLPRNLDGLRRALPLRADQMPEARQDVPAHQQIVDLAEALDLVHAQGILHRAIDFSALALDRSKGVDQLVLTGFEYSANIRAKLFGRQTGRLSDYRLSPWNLACRPPEAGSGIGDLIDPAADVYGFGAVAIMLATGLPSAKLLDQVDHELPIARSNRTASEKEADHVQMSRLSARLRDDLLDYGRWPADDEELTELRDILAPCLTVTAANRPTMEDLTARLRLWRDNSEANRAYSGQTFLAAYSDKEMGLRLKNLGLIKRDLDLSTADGRAFLQDTLQEWLQAARFIHYRERGFPRGGDDNSEIVRKRSTYVFAGKTVVFFASKYHETSNSPADDTLLWLGYVIRRSELSLPDPDELGPVGQRSSIEDRTWIVAPAKVKVFPRADLDQYGSRISWGPILALVEQRGKQGELQRLGAEAAAVWRLHRDLMIAREEIRNFPVRVETPHGAEPGHFKLLLDEDAFRSESERGNIGFLRRLLIEGKNLRAFFADTIQAMANEQGGDDLLAFLLPRKVGEIDFRNRIEVRIKLPVINNSVEIELTDREDASRMPAYGRLRWMGAYGAQAAITRQSLAIELLERRSWLMGAIVRPSGMESIRLPVSQYCGDNLKAKGEFVEELQNRVSTMISADPLHAVQGPPGTGKTTLVASMVTEALANEDGARILLTSQSHAATDNVLLATMETVRKSQRYEGRDNWRLPTAIRLFSDLTRDSVDPIARDRYSIDKQAKDALRRMQRKSDEAGAVTNDYLKKAYEHLGRAAKTGYLETRLKFERSSPMVFSTTGAAMTARDFLRRGAIGFDYVIIDEAARAFASDLAQAMALADRVIWVGDQAQLPPFGETELFEILERAVRRRHDDSIPTDLAYLMDEITSSKKDTAILERIKGWLKLFHRLFEVQPPRSHEEAEPGVIPMTQALDRQFRSVESIGELVAKTFYPKLKIRHSGPKPDTDRRIALHLVQGTVAREIKPAIAWIDTSALGAKFNSQSETGFGLSNKGEGEIVQSILSLFSATLAVAGDPWEKLRILSPYRSQVAHLRRLYVGRSAELGTDKESLSRLFQTVDSAQGSEADIVIISLARRIPGLATEPPVAPLGDEARIAQLTAALKTRLGFLQEPERINVMMSRARQQIILLGDFAYYKHGAALLDEFIRLDSRTLEARSFWTSLLADFRPFDPTVPVDYFDAEQPLIIPADMILTGAK